MRRNFANSLNNNANRNFFEFFDKAFSPVR